MTVDYDALGRYTHLQQQLEDALRSRNSILNGIAFHIGQSQRPAGIALRSHQRLLKDARFAVLKQQLIQAEDAEATARAAMAQLNELAEAAGQPVLSWVDD